MNGLFRNGLDITLDTPPPATGGAVRVMTDEAAFLHTPEEDFRVETLVSEGDLVEQGAPVLRSRRHPEILVTAPMSARVAAIELSAGHRLSRISFFSEPDAGRRVFGTPDERLKFDAANLRRLMLQSGLWRQIRSRPFGHVPPPDERPRAIFVMALDTRPLAVDPAELVRENRIAFEHGLHALATQTDGPLFVVQTGTSDIAAPGGMSDKLRLIKTDNEHPQGLAGLHILRLHPARIGGPVWDLCAEDVIALGALVETGLVRETRRVRVAGPAMRETRLVETQPGADLRELTAAHVKPGSYRIFSGSALDGKRARWLGQRDRLVTVMPQPRQEPQKHWFANALTRASRPLPLIPTTAMDRATAGALPAMALYRALSAGDTETAAKLGALSLLPEDLSLADYVTAADPSLSSLLSGVLRRIAEEDAQ